MCAPTSRWLGCASAAKRSFQGFTPWVRSMYTSEPPRTKVSAMTAQKRSPAAKKHACLLCLLCWGGTKVQTVGHKTCDLTLPCSRAVLTQRHTQLG